MATTTSPPAPTDTSNVTASPTRPPGGDALAEIGAVLVEVAQRDRRQAAQSADELEIRHQFLEEFDAICEREVRPAMEAVVDQLQHTGGGGLIEHHGAGEVRVRSPRLMLWMSLEGAIDGIPRYDRNPYLQLDADDNTREVQVSEGDLWLGGGSRSGPVGVWQLAEISRDRVIEELLAVVRRAAALTATTASTTKQEVSK